MNDQRIGSILINRGLITEADLAGALKFQSEIGGLIGQALLRLGAISEDDLLACLSEQLGLPIARADDLPSDNTLISQAADFMNISPQWLAAHNAGLWFIEGVHQHQLVATLVADLPYDAELREVVDRKLALIIRNPSNNYQSFRVDSFLATNSMLQYIREALTAQARSASDADEDLSTQRLREMAEEAPVIDFVNRVFSASLSQNASDIHIEPNEHDMQVRFRIDGVLHTIERQPRSRFNAISSRIKLISGMDIAEHRLPQDGRQSVRFAGETLDLRVSSLPGTWGESLVLRLLRKEKSLPDLEGLGLDGNAKRAFDVAKSYQNGIVLVTGPTGSGKSTTLYRSLEELNDGVRKIITIEDPVEYNMKGITQIQIKADIGYTFARGLRAILRQDPDIIMIGEIRDGETATIAAQAALTGHLVFSTLHTNSSLAAIERLLDLGLEPFLIISAVRALMAQRLVRRVCEHCSIPSSSPEAQKVFDEARRENPNLERFTIAQPGWKQTVGCNHCNGTGYKGRIALFEVALLDSALRDAIISQKSTTGLLSVAREQGFLTLFEDGILKARSGLTTVDEVMRVVGTSSDAGMPIIAS